MDLNTLYLFIKYIKYKVFFIKLYWIKNILNSVSFGFINSYVKYLVLKLTPGVAAIFYNTGKDYF